MQDNKEEMQQEQEYLTQTPSIQWFRDTWQRPAG